MRLVTRRGDGSRTIAETPAVVRVKTAWLRVQCAVAATQRGILTGSRRNPLYPNALRVTGRIYPHSFRSTRYHSGGAVVLRGVTLTCAGKIRDHLLSSGAGGTRGISEVTRTCAGGTCATTGA